MESADHFPSRPDCNNTGVPSLMVCGQGSGKSASLLPYCGGRFCGCSSVSHTRWCGRRGLRSCGRRGWQKLWEENRRQLKHGHQSYIEGIRNTEFFVSSFSPFNVIVHWHEDDSSLDLLRFTLLCQTSCCESRRRSAMWRILWNFPLELHRLVDSIEISTLEWIQKPIDLLLPSFDGVFADPSLHFPDSENTWVFCIW